MTDLTRTRHALWNHWRMVSVFVICVVLPGCADITQSDTRVNATSLPSGTSDNNSINIPMQSLDENVSHAKEFTVASILAKEPLQGNISRRYVMQLTRNAFGSGNGESRASDKDFVNCWLFDRTVAVKQCSFREYAEEMWNEVRSSQPGQLLKTAYISYSVVPDTHDSLLARVLIYESYSQLVDEHYWVMTIRNTSGIWQKESLSRHPLPFPSTW